MATQVGLDHDAVVAAAGDLVDEAGVEALTLAALASRLGIRSQSLYAHVDGLDGLLRDLALDSVRTLGDELRSSVIGRSGREALEAIADAYWDYARAHPGSVRGDDPRPRRRRRAARRQPAGGRGTHPGARVVRPHRRRRGARAPRGVVGHPRLPHPRARRRAPPAASVRESYRRMIAMLRRRARAPASRP